MTSYTAGAYAVAMDAIYAMLSYERQVKKEIKKNMGENNSTYDDNISELIIGYYDMFNEYSYCAGITKPEEETKEVEETTSPVLNDTGSVKKDVK